MNNRPLNIWESGYATLLRLKNLLRMEKNWPSNTTNSYPKYGPGTVPSLDVTVPSDTKT